VLDDVREWYGCSGGALVAFFGALGVTSVWLREAIQHFDTRLLAEIGDDHVANFLEAWGISDGRGAIEYVGRFADTWEPGASTWTFADLAAARPGIRLVLTATNVTRRSAAVFSVETTPELRILDALRASLSIPLFFTPWRDASGDLYCDGAVMEYYPWAAVRDPSATLVLVCEEGGILGRRAAAEPVDSLARYLGRIVSIVQRRTGSAPRNWISVGTSFVTPIDFHVTKEMRLGLFAAGEAAARGWLAFRASVTPAAGIATDGCRLQCGDRDTSPSGPCSPERTSGNRQSGSPPRPPSPSRDLRSGEPRSSRRWSL
jgi:predicted acylesterase/phospholipase RssA